MEATKQQQKNKHLALNGYLLCLLGFAIPVSTFVADVLVGLLALSWLFEADFSEKWKEIKAHKWVLALLATLSLYLLGLLWGDAHGQAAWLFEKQALLLTIPILLTLKVPKAYWHYALWAFLGAVTFSALLDILIEMGYLYHLYNYTSLVSKNWSFGAFKVYTSHNLFMALGAFLLLALLRGKSWSRLSTYFLLFALALLVSSLFLERGRAAQLTFICCFALLMTYLLRKRIGLLAIALVAMALSLQQLYTHHQVFQDRMKAAVAQFTEDEKAAQSSVGARYLFAQYSWDMIVEKPMLGHGTGSFVENMKQRGDQAAGLVAKEHKTPHNNYLYVATELGVIGLLVFLSIFLFQLQAYWQLPHKEYALILPLFFLIVMWSDAYIQQHDAAITYAFLSALFVRWRKVDALDSSIQGS
jgi:O-antigen ligase